MFRLAYEQANPHQKCDECMQTTVCVVSPLYLDNLDDIVDDILTLRFNILQKYQKKLTDDEADDWLMYNNEITDSEYAAQFTNGVCTFFLLSRINAILLGERLAVSHNSISSRKTGKNSVYFSHDLVEAHRDVRIHFPEYAKSHSSFEEAIENARQYANSHLINPVCQQLANMDLVNP